MAEAAVALAALLVVLTAVRAALAWRVLHAGALRADDCARPDRPRTSPA